MNMKPLGTVAIVGCTAIVLYFLTIGIAVDAMDGFVEADVLAGQLPDMSIINAILAVYTVVIAGCLVVSAAVLSHDPRIAGISVLAGGIALLIVVFIGLMSQPGLQMSPEKWLIAPALYTAFVLRDPGAFLAIEAGCVGAAYLANSIIHAVMN